MSESRLYLGIDLGTSNSTVSYVYHDPRYADAKCIDAKVLQVAADDEGIVSTGRVPTVVYHRSSAWPPLLGNFSRMGETKS